jgi:hypothetical protein
MALIGYDRTTAAALLHTFLQSHAAGPSHPPMPADHLPADRFYDSFTWIWSCCPGVIS